jgi:hypothetical protein
MYIVISDCRSFLMCHMRNLSRCATHMSGYIMPPSPLELEGGKPGLTKTQEDATREYGVY